MCMCPCSPVCRWSETTRQWTRQTFELPAGVKAGGWRVKLSAPVPGVNQAFATGAANTTAGKAINCVWRWTGGATWKVVQVRWESSALPAGGPPNGRRPGSNEGNCAC